MRRCRAEDLFRRQLPESARLRSEASARKRRGPARRGGPWDLPADVVVVGSGAAGLPASISAAEQGASVIVVEQNYDIGGHAIESGGNIALGGGTRLQN